jgi:O-antigen ligase
MLFNVASLFWTVSYETTIIRVITYLQLAILTWILWDLFTTPASLRQAMQFFILGAYLTIASQLINFATGQTISAYNAGRFSGAGQNAGEFALILSLTLPLAWHLAITQEPGAGAVALRIVNFTYIPLALFATVLTASRTSLLTNIPGLLYIVGTLSKIKRVYRIMIFIVFVTSMILIQPVIPQATLDRLSTIGASIEEMDLGGRAQLWKGSFAIFLKHPYIGIGSDALSAPDQLGSFAHNTFLSIMAELGLVGLFLFLCSLLIVIYQALRQPKQYSFLWITVIAIWLMGVSTLTWEYTKSTWFYLNLVIISAGIYSQRNHPFRNPAISAIPSAYRYLQSD